MYSQKDEFNKSHFVKLVETFTDEQFILFCQIIRQEKRQVYTLAEVTETLKVSDDTITRAISKGDLEGYKIGRDWRFDEEQLSAFLKRRTVSRRKKKSVNLI